MPQSPLQVDAIQIEPGSGDTLTIGRDADGNLVFVDTALASGATLTELAGVRSVDQVLTVGVGGSGAAYTSVQDALDAVPVSSDKDTPYTILVLGGVFTENLTVEKDGVRLVGLGRPVLTAASGDIITIQGSVTSIPKSFEIKGFRVEVQEGGKCCILASGGSGSQVLVEGGLVTDCDLVSSGAGGFPLRATSINRLVAAGGDWGAGQATSSVRVTNCSDVTLQGQARLPHVQFDFDTGGDIPASTTCTYVVRDAPLVGDVQSQLSGRGSLSVQHCGKVGDVSLSGDQSFQGSFSVFDAITVNDTVAAELVQSQHGALAGAGTLDSTVQGSATFANVAFVDVAFDVPMPDANYVVGLEVGVADTAYVTNKGAAGFRVNFSGLQTTVVGWVARRA